MNSKLYKLVFCRRLGCLIAVGEFTRSYGKSFSSTGGRSIKDKNARAGILSRLAIMTGLALGTFPILVLAHPSLPVNGQIVIGQGGIDVNNTTLTVVQQSDKLAINWGSFDIAQGNSVIYNQPGQQSIALNRVLGRDASQIYGNLKANGQVFLLNPNGILFGKGAQVDVGGLVASTKSMSNHDFIRGCYTLTSEKNEGQVINQANLRTTPGGYIALVGQRVDNQSSGVINSPQGKVVVASGSRVTLNLDHGNLLGVQIQGEQVSTLLRNGGLIQADGGVIQLTARGREMVMDTVIDHTGILQARSLSEKNGAIYLDGDSEGVVSQKGLIDVSSPQGRGGSVVLQGENIHLAAGSKIAAHGAEGGGKVLVGGDWQGKSHRIKKAHSVAMDKGADIDVAATGKGPGGTTVLWSEYYTGFYGDINARGGPQSGDGGRVETSSRRNLQAFGQVDASAINGGRGRWLLDPAEVSIVGNGAESGSSMRMGDIPAGYVTNAQVFVPTTNVAQILNTSINSQLNAGTNVTITTSNSSLLSCRWCNITLSADINKTAGADSTLTLHADGNIEVYNNITSNMGKLNVNLLSGNSTVDSVITLNNSHVLLNGGDLLAKHADQNHTARISILGGRYEVGNLTLDGNTGVASQVGVNISNSATVFATGKIDIIGESSNTNGQGWRGIDISGGSTLTGASNMAFNFKSNSKTSWMGSFSNATITSDKDITFQVNGSAIGGVDIINSNISSRSGNISFNVTGNIITSGLDGLRINGSQVSGKNIKFESNITGADGVLLKNSNITATSGDISANVTTNNKGVFILGNTNINASNNINLTAKTSNSTFAGADAIKIIGNSNGEYVNITSGGHISMVAVNTGKEIGSTIAADYANIKAQGGDFNLNISGVKGSPITNVSISANNISLSGNISDNDAVVMTNTFLTAKGDIKSNLSAPANKALYFKGNGGMVADQNILLVVKSAKETVETVTINGTPSNRMNVTAGKDISIISSDYGNASGGGIGIAYVNVETKSGNFTAENNGSKSIGVANTNITANEINFVSNSTDFTGLLVRESNVTATTGNINANGTSQREGVRINSNTIFNAKKDINLTGIANGNGEGIDIQGSSNSSRNNLIAQGNVTLNGKTGSGASIRPSISLLNTNLTSTENNIDINGSSEGARNVYFTDVDLNATAGNISVYSETMSALPATASTALSFGGNISIKAKNSTVIGKALNTVLGSGVGFRANNSLSVEGNVTFQGETEGIGATHNGIAFYGENTLNVAKGSQLSFFGENKGAQNTADGNGITYLNPQKLTVNNNGSLIINGRSTSGSGVSFPTSNNTLILSGDGDTLIKGSSVTGGGAVISGVVNNSTGSVTIEGASTEGVGVHLFSGEHQINRINVTGCSTQAEGLRISGNATIIDTVLTGKSVNGSGVIIDSLPGSSVATHTVLNNAALNGSSTNDKGVEVTSNINGVNHSRINGTVDGLGYGIDIGENLSVTGTSEADLLMLQGVATTIAGTGIKLNGNNDLSNTSLNGSAVDGIALDIIGPFTNSRNTELKGMASGSGIGVQINGLLSDSVVNGASASGVGIQLNGSLDNSRINGKSSSGSGVKISGNSVLNNTALIGNSADGKGVDVTANLTGSNGSSVQGNVVNGTGVIIDIDAILTGGGSDDLLAVSGNATGEQGHGVRLGGNNTLDNTTLSGNATNGSGVNITGPLTNNGTTAITGLAENGSGVRLDGIINGVTVNGTSTNGRGIYVDSDTILDNATLNGNSANGTGVAIAGDLAGSNGSAVRGETTDGTGVYVVSDVAVTGGGEDDPLVVSGNATGNSGIGVQLDGNNTLDNTTLAGSATNGTGVDIDGPLTNKGNSTVDGNATNGDGVELNGTLTGGMVNGTSDSGLGINVDGDTTLDNTILNGNSANGTGVAFAGDLAGSNGSAVRGETTDGTGVYVVSDVAVTGGGEDDPLVVSGNATGNSGIGVQLDGNNTLDNTTLAGSATNGTGVDIDGPLTNKGNSTVDGNATNGDGVELNGTLTGGTVNGTSDSGRGIKVDGDTTLDNATLNGNSPNGSGVVIAGNLTGSNGSAVRGETTDGTGVYVVRDVAVTGGGEDDPLAVSGNATGNSGIGVLLDGNNTLDNTSLAGSATDGHGVEITDPLVNKGNTTIEGSASNNGHGVHINGPVSGGVINGTSGNNHGIFLDEFAQINNIDLGGNTNSDKSSVQITSPELIGENVTINGKAVDKNSIGGRTLSGPTTVSGSIIVSDSSNGSVEKVLPQGSVISGPLLMMRQQILTSLEEQQLPPSVVTESEQDIAENISIAVCIPSHVSTGQQPCDEHVLGRRKPIASTKGPK
ncbi:filamentous hemagglutinin N-terminal domain-containing protein [Yersinia sp. Marseille-Q3913]|uniref:two-partner secretion domain-containing protein n=1 Tax=Yersinia sp. Marseille-Q3913 TaxID=2830769 RepID=UPI001BB0A4D0|nr:filamentous hemagglutinin N-terminal domain-containing protein [Yersinia sp. Marseille-Q3913]MBS0054396.1 filamentous hemagglutinin N-terminal domain-containing protein [Yersinia sp. Marseille-Q3913]